jgi:predicted aspartyl protease
MRWTRRSMLAAGAALSAFPALAQVAPAAPPANTGAPTAVQGGSDGDERLTVKVMVNGQGPYDFVVDTGAERSALSTELAAELMLPSGPPMIVHGVAGALPTASALVDSLGVGGRRLENITVPLLARGNIGAAGVLGIDAVQGQRVVLDFRHNRILVEDTAPRGRSVEDIVVHARSRFGQLVLVDSYFHSQPVLVVVDTGAQNTIGNSALRAKVRYEPTADALGSTRTDIFSVTGQTTTGDWALVSAVHVGGFEMSHLPIVFSDLHSFARWDLQTQPALLLGMDVLRQFETVEIDFARREVRFKNLITPGQRLTSTGSRLGLRG